MELIKEIGAYAGLGAFLGLAVLSLLYFSQARDVRRLRDWAGRAPERDAEEVEATSGLAAERAEELRKLEEDRRRREEATAVEQEAATSRERRRQRREAGLPAQTRRERVEAWFSRGRARGRPELRYVAVGVGAVVLLGAAVAVALTQLGDDGDGTSAAALRPGQIEVSVLNGTSAPGLAARISDRLEARGFRTGTVGNTGSPFDISSVMFRRGHRPEAAKVAQSLRIARVRLMVPDVSDRSAPARVAVVAGEDKVDSFIG